MLFDLINTSPKYREISVGEIYETIVAAHQHNRMFIWTNPDGVWLGFMTFAFLPPDMVEDFVNGTYNVRNDDFARNDGLLWVMDFIAPFGNVSSMMMDAQHRFAELFGDGTLIQWKRSKHTPPKLGWVYARKRFDVAA